MERGYFGIGILNGKNNINYGTLYRTAFILGASFVFLIGKRFKKQTSDTLKSYRHLPTYDYINFEQFYVGLPYGCQLIGIEMEERAVLIEEFKHPKIACYLLGAEDNGLTQEAISKCHKLIKLQGFFSMNVSVAGSIVLYDRISKDL